MHHPWLRVRLPVVRAVLFGQLIGFCLVSKAQTSTISATSAATAGSGRASVEAIDVHSLNPANLVHLRDRDVHAVGANNASLVGLTDNSKENIVAGAASFDHTKVGKDEAAVINEDYRLTGAQFAAEHFAIGISGHMLQSKQTDGSVWKQWNGDVGLSWAPTHVLGFALVGYDLLKAKEDVPTEVRVRSQIGFGTQYIWRDFVRLRADLVTGPGEDWTKRSLRLGYESYMNKFALLRFGLAEDRNAGTRFFGAGLGLELPKFRLNYAYQGGIQGDFENRHSVDLGIPF